MIIEHEPVQWSLDQQVATVLVSRPEALNALNPDVLQSLHLVFDKLEQQQDIRAVVITGDGEKAFVAGADIRSMSSLGPRAIADYVELGQRVMRKIERFHRPVIAAIRGYALGGGLELALACDLIVAAKDAKLGQPEINLGIIPGFGGTQRLIARAGVGTARYLCLTGELLTGEEAFGKGIVDCLPDTETAYERACALARVIAQKAPLAVAGVKEVIRKSEEQRLLAGLRFEVESFLSLYQTGDREEGMQAFLERRPPVFRGK